MAESHDPDEETILAEAPPDPTEFDDSEVGPPPEPPTEIAAKRTSKRSRRRRPAGGIPPLETIGEKEATEKAAEITEREVTRAFFYTYRLFCRVVGAKPEATILEFSQFGKAWIDLLKRVPGIKVILVLLGPAVTMAELLDRFDAAWQKRTRFRGSSQLFRRRVPRPEPATPDFQVVDGAAGAP